MSSIFFLTNLLQCDPVAAGRSQTNVKLVCCHQSTPMWSCSCSRNQ